MGDPVVLWRCAFFAGHDAARLTSSAAGHALAGAAALGFGGAPAMLRYQVTCGATWETRTTSVEGWFGAREVRVHLAADAARRWTLNGRPMPEVEGCIDVDLGFTPATNTLPIRRLGLAVGESAAVRAAWLRFPTLELAVLDQVYHRTDERTYRYESNGGSFVRDLTVDEHGLVVSYPDFWERDLPAEP
jgi:hypothetical protein